ncbi:MAG: SRPBCC domain-containing protein [Balneolaceae bacterium]|nr:SRPBCC domain-containing protein [Balneolaceae bacterium]MBO6547187.1 SRPBCC domain-containing protein [Balneolaceae bacterium]MBO6647866.1 SRPBCC domain-containing protein [Balneolaceae bacterium]
MDIIHEFEIKTTEKQTFDAITTEEGINGWWSKDCDIPTAEGETMRVRFTDHNVEMGFRIDELVENRKVVWTCVENPNPAFLDTVIQFDIKKSSSGIQFRFNHSNWDEQWDGKINFEQSKESWKHFMNSLKSYLETGTGQPW